jgi:hypothetical protein
MYGGIFNLQLLPPKGYLLTKRHWAIGCFFMLTLWMMTRILQMVTIKDDYLRGLVLLFGAANNMNILVWWIQKGKRAGF